jgi:type II secretory pathway pseudopilin PulG
MTKSPTPPALPFNRPGAAERGFALVVTLMLMVLLAVLSVGLLGLSTVTLRTSSRGAALAEARANANMALMMAIGQLQRELGPDSRISAPHDAGSPSGGRPRWTAVYDAWKAPDSTGNEADTPESRVVNFRDWLVSAAPGASTADEIELVGAGTLGVNAVPEDLIRVPSLTVNANGSNGRIAWCTSIIRSRSRWIMGGSSCIHRR